MKLFNNVESNKSSLRKRMIFYFLLIAIANVLVAGEFLWEIRSSAYREKVTKVVSVIKEGKESVEHVYTILDNLSWKFVIMILILIIVSAVVLFLFVWQIASPMQYMINQAEKMSEGDLSIRIDVKTGDEIAILGKLINDLSINLQEVIAQLERMVYEMDSALDTFRNDISDKPVKLSTVKLNLILLEKSIKKLELLKDNFILYTIDGLKKNAED